MIKESRINEAFAALNICENYKTVMLSDVAAITGEPMYFNRALLYAMRIDPEIVYRPLERKSRFSAYEFKVGSVNEKADMLSKVAVIDVPNWQLVQYTIGVYQSVLPVKHTYVGPYDAATLRRDTEEVFDDTDVVITKDAVCKAYAMAISYFLIFQARSNDEKDIVGSIAKALNVKTIEARALIDDLINCKLVLYTLDRRLKCMVTEEDMQLYDYSDKLSFSVSDNDNSFDKRYDDASLKELRASIDSATKMTEQLISVYSKSAKTNTDTVVEVFKKLAEDIPEHRDRIMLAMSEILMKG